MDFTLCKMCKEPVWSFICVDCLAEDIKQTIPQSLHEDFRKFHADFVKHFEDFRHLQPCIKCGHPSPVTVCPYCYINEAHSLLMEKDMMLAKRLIRFAPFFRHGYSERDARTITELENDREFRGICDECGEYSNRLRETEKGWVCEGCT